MPGHRVHSYVDRQLFGKAYWKLHRKMDVAVFWLGKGHRVLYHDPLTAGCIAKTCYPNDPNAEEAAYTHILLDDFCTAYPAWKKLLEQLAAMLMLNVENENAKRRKNVVVASSPPG